MRKYKIRNLIFNDIVTKYNTLTSIFFKKIFLIIITFDYK